MSTEQNDLTSLAGTGLGSNPTSETDNSASSGNDATNEAPPQVDWEAKFKDSSRGVQQMMERQRQQEQQWLADRMRYEAELATLRQQQASPRQDPSRTSSEEYISEAEAKELADAQFSADWKKVQEIQTRALKRASADSAKRAKEELFTELQQGVQEASKIGGITNLVRSIPGANDPYSPVSTRITELYRAYYNDPEMQHLDHTEDTNWNGYRVNPQFMTLAVKQAKQEFTKSAAPVRTESFTEPSNRSATNMNNRLDPERLMTREELEQVRAIGMDPQDWLKYNPNTPERVKAGKPIPLERRGGEVVFRPTPRKK